MGEIEITRKNCDGLKLNHELRERGVLDENNQINDVIETYSNVYVFFEEDYVITPQQSRKLHDFGLSLYSSDGGGHIEFSAKKNELNWEHVEPPNDFVAVVEYAGKNEPDNPVKEIYPKGESVNDNFADYEDKLVFVTKTRYRMTDDFGDRLMEKGYYIAGDDSVSMTEGTERIFIVKEVDE